MQDFWSNARADAGEALDDIPTNTTSDAGHILEDIQQFAMPEAEAVHASDDIQRLVMPDTSEASHELQITDTSDAPGTLED